MLGLKKKVSEIKNKHFYPALSKLSGNVLEIGFGNGDNFGHYSENCNIFALEKSEKKILKAEQGNYNGNIELIKGNAERLKFPNNHFDAVVLTFVLCSVHSVERAVNEIKRVLKPEGRFIMLEHIRSENKVIGKLQDLFAKPIALISDNCHLNRKPKEIVASNGFDVYSKKYFTTHVTDYLFMESKTK